MPLTVAGLEQNLLLLLSPYFPLVGMDESATGANEYLRIPIQEAVGRMGIETADALDVVDADLADLDRTQVTTLRSLAELETLEIIANRYIKVDQSAGEESQSLGQRFDRLKWRIESLTDQLGPLAVDEASASLPGPSAAGIIRAGRCYPYGVYDYGDGCRPYRTGWGTWPW